MKNREEEVKLFIHVYTYYFGPLFFRYDEPFIIE